MSYGWLITKDVLSGHDPVNTEVGTIGPRGISEELQERLRNGEGEKFELYDDDDILYYKGLLINGDGFEPLDDFGMPNAGCTAIKINGRWV